MAKENKPNPPASAEEDVFIFNLFRKMGSSGEEATTFHRIMQNTASANIVAQLGSKIDAQNAKIDAQDKKYTLLLWFIGVGVGLIIASNFVS